MMRLSFYLITMIFTTSMLFSEDFVTLQYQGPDVYKTQWGINRPIFVDLNNDGKKDFIITDIHKGKLELHLSQSDEEINKPDTEEASTKDVNKITYDKKYKIEYFLTENQIVGLWAGNLFNEKKNNIIYTTGTNELIILEKNKSDVWEKKLIYDCKSLINLGIQNIFVDDFNSDKLKDILLITQYGFEFKYQDKEGNFTNDILQPIEESDLNKIININILDINSDKKKDICMLVNDKEFLKYRLQLEDGSFSPEQSLEGDKIYDGTLTHLESKSDKTYLVSIQAKSNAISINEIDFKNNKQSDSSLFGSIEQLHLPVSKKPYSILLNDINNDKQLDLIATTPSAAEVILYTLDKKGQYHNVKRFASYMEINDMQVFDWEKDGKLDLYLLSKKENKLGKCTWANEELPFPQTVQTQDAPEAFLFAPLTKEDANHLFVMETSTSADDKNKKQSVLRIYAKEGEKAINEFLFEKTISDPSLKAVDINHDGKTDIIIFEKYSKPQVLVQKEEQKFELLNQKNAKLGLLLDSKIKPWQVSYTQKEGQTLPALSSQNFSRIIQLKEDSLETLEQYNSEETNASIEAMVQADLDGDKNQETIMYDDKNHLIDIYHKTENGLTRKEKIKLPNIKFTGMQLIDLNNDKKKDIILLGESKILILKANTATAKLIPISIFQPDENKHKHFMAIEVGNILPGRFQEIAITDSANQSIDIFYLNKQGKLNSLIDFKVFEERHFQQNQESFQPQHVIIEDLNGDQLNDIFVIAHDKILIYTQKGN